MLQGRTVCIDGLGLCGDSIRMRRHSGKLPFASGSCGHIGDGQMMSNQP